MGTSLTKLRLCLLLFFTQIHHSTLKLEYVSNTLRYEKNQEAGRHILCVTATWFISVVGS